MSGSALAHDAELEQLWKHPDLLRRMFRWGAAAPAGCSAPLQHRPSCSAAGLPRLCQPRPLRTPCHPCAPLSRPRSWYAALYVRLLQRHGEADKLLQLLLGMKKRVKTFGAAEPKQARFLRRQALELSDALLGTLGNALDSLQLSAELEAGPADTQQAAQQPAAAAPREAEGAAGASAEAQAQEQGWPPAGEQASAEAGQTPAPGAAPAGGRTATPGTDLRAVLGTPSGALPTEERQQLQEQGMALLQVAHSFHKDVARWLQVRLRLGGRARKPRAGVLPDNQGRVQA